MEAIRWLALFSQVRSCSSVLVVVDDSPPGADPMDFPILDLMDQEGCRQKLFDLLHPEGFACPRCGAREGLNIHRRHPDSPVVDYRCKGCRRVFNMFTGTPWQGTHLSPAQILLILRGIAQGVPTAKLAREVGISRQHLLRLRHEIQARALAAADRSPLPDDQTEADEMYQNAGEKRGAARRPRRPAAAACEPGQGPRHLGDRPAAGPRGGRPGQRTGVVSDMDLYLHSTGVRSGATSQASRAAAEFTAPFWFGSSIPRNSKRRNSRNSKSERGKRRQHTLPRKHRPEGRTEDKPGAERRDERVFDGPVGGALWSDRQPRSCGGRSGVGSGTAARR